MKVDRRGYVAGTNIVSVVEQTGIERDPWCRGVVRYNKQYDSGSRCGNIAWLYIFVDDADEPRVPVCNLHANIAAKGRLRVAR